MADHLIQSAAVTAPGMVTFSYFTPDSPDHRYIGIAEQACRSITACSFGCLPVSAADTPDARLRAPHLG